MVGDKNNKGFISLWDLRDKMTDEEIMSTYSLIRGEFEDKHPQNMVDASDAFVLTVFPFGREDEQPDEYETVELETGLYDGLPAMRCVADNSIMVVD